MLEPSGRYRDSERSSSFSVAKMQLSSPSQSSGHLPGVGFTTTTTTSRGRNPKQYIAPYLPPSKDNLRRSATYRRHSKLTFESPPYSIINSLWFPPVGRHTFERVALMSIEVLRACARSNISNAPVSMRVFVVFGKQRTYASSRS